MLHHEETLEQTHATQSFVTSGFPADYSVWIVITQLAHRP